MQISNETLSRYDEFFRYARSRARSIDDAEDIVQTALEDVLRCNYTAPSLRQEMGVIFQYIRWAAARTYSPRKNRAAREHNLEPLEGSRDRGGMDDFGGEAYDALEQLSPARPTERIAEVKIYLSSLQDVMRHFEIAACFGLAKSEAMDIFPLGFVDMAGNMGTLDLQPGDKRRWEHVGVGIDFKERGRVMRTLNGKPRSDIRAGRYIQEPAYA